MIRVESIRLTISNIIFHIESDGYKMLTSYLKNAHDYFHNEPNGQKTFEEFEFKVSEILLDKLKEGSATVKLNHIKAVKNTLGVIKKPAVKSKAIKPRNPINQQSIDKVFSIQQNLQKVVVTIFSILGLSF